MSVEKISVILTSYNHEKYLRKSIDSILEQTYQNYELIIVDDCSTDNSWGIIEEYKRKFPQIKIIRHEYNWGNGMVEDTVKNYATGDYIAIHHSDDIWEKDKLQKQVEIIEKMPDCAAVFTNAIAINDDGEPYSDENGFYYNLFLVENRSRYEWLNYFFYKGNCLCHPSILIKKDVYMEDGFFRKGLRQIPDFVKWIQVCKKHEIYVLPEPLVKFRIHKAGKNTSGMRADTQVRSTVELFLMLDEYADITAREEFLKVFPEAEKYCTEDFFSTDFALGKICTQEGMPVYTRLYGDKLLYKVLNQPKMADVIEKYFNYTKKNYTMDNGKYDIFGILPKAFEQIRSLYVDRGNGFCENEVYHEKFTFGEEEEFSWKCTLENSEEKISSLRFDPVEGVLTKVKLDQVMINGVIAEYVAENALCKKNEYEVFVNLDPIYAIKIPEKELLADELKIMITGEVIRITDDEINQIVSENMYSNRDKIYDYEQRVQKLVSENESLTQENQEMLVRLKKIESTWLYK